MAALAHYGIRDLGTLWNRQREEKLGSVVEGNAREIDVVVRARRKRDTNSSESPIMKT